MPAVPKRFIITYLLAFALLWGIGVFTEKLSINPNAARFPWEGRSKVSHHWPVIEVYVLNGIDGESSEFVVMNDMIDDNPRYPDSLASTRERILGVVSVWWRRHQDVAAPFIIGERNYVEGEYYYFEGRTIPAEALEDAKAIAYVEARRWFDTTHFALEEINFHTPDTPIGTHVEPVFGGREYHRAMPWWALISLFAFAPMLAALTVTYATARIARGAR